MSLGLAGFWPRPVGPSPILSSAVSEVRSSPTLSSAVSEVRSPWLKGLAPVFPSPDQLPPTLDGSTHILGRFLVSRTGTSPHSQFGDFRILSLATHPLVVPDLMPYTLNSLSIDVHLSKAQEPHGGRDPQNLAMFIAHKGWCQIVENRIISHSKIS